MKTKEMSKKRLRTQTITKIALLVACLSVSAYITIPLGFTPVSLTLQTLIVNMIAILLTPWESFTALLVYILLGFVGLPIFSGGAGGPAKLFGPTGGYIFAFLISAPLMSWLKDYIRRAIDKFIKNTVASQVVAYTVNAIVIGMTIVYLIGTVYMKFLTGRTFSETLLLAVVPFIPLDIVKCVFAAVIGVPVKRALER
ncbi:MAG: biotin transporter BioY [Clostridia bacterium]